MNRQLLSEIKIDIVFLGRYLDAVLNICSQFDVPFFLLVECFIYLNQTLTQQGYTTFIEIFSNDVSKVKRHKRRLKFAVRSFSM